MIEAFLKKLFYSSFFGCGKLESSCLVKMTSKVKRIIWNFADKWHCLVSQTRPLFVYFHSFNCKYSTKFWLPINDKSVDGVLGTWTRGGRMEGADESTELCRHPLKNIFGLSAWPLISIPYGLFNWVWPLYICATHCGLRRGHHGKENLSFNNNSLYRLAVLLLPVNEDFTYW